MPGTHYPILYALAEQRHGYVTTTDAASAGISRFSLARMVERGVIERMSHGVYRLVHFPFSPMAQYAEAVLWTMGRTRQGHANYQGVLSHDTALVLHELGNLNPAKIHLTLPRTARTHRTVPRVYVLHHADLRPDEIMMIDSLPVTTATRAIYDCWKRGLGPAILRDAIADGRRRGIFTRVEADRLTRDVLKPVSS